MNGQQFLMGKFSLQLTSADEVIVPWIGQFNLPTRGR